MLYLISALCNDMQNIIKGKIAVSKSKKYPNIDVPHEFWSVPTLVGCISNIDLVSAMKFVISIITHFFGI